MMKFIGSVLALAIGVAMLSPHGGSNPPVASDATSSTDGPTASHATSTSTVSPAMGNGFGSVVLTRQPDGHFYTDAQVNGATIHFLVDTGASDIALSRADAQSAGVQFASGDFTGTAQTAGGTVALKPVTLDHVSVGSLDAHNVQGVVVDTPMGISLLGQSWLKQVGTVTIEGDRMTQR